MPQKSEDRPRGFLTQADRDFLSTPEEELEVQEQTKRKRRDRIHERTYNAILDFKFLEGMSQVEREKLFDEIQDNWMEDAHAFSSMIEFVYLGLLEAGLAEGLPPLIESGILEAMSTYNQTHGEYLHVTPSVEISIEHRFDPDEDGETTADYDKSLLEEMYLDQFDEPDSGLDTAEHVRRHYQVMANFGLLEIENRDPDPEREEEAVELVREFCERNEIDSMGEFEQFVSEAPDDHSIHTLVDTMKTVISPINVDLDRPDTVEEALDSLKPADYTQYKEKFRPQGVEDWDPSSDPALEEWIAFQEATGDHMTQEKYWDRLKEEVGFNPDEWDFEAIREMVEKEDSALGDDIERWITDGVVEEDRDA